MGEISVNDLRIYTYLKMKLQATFTPYSNKIFMKTLFDTCSWKFNRITFCKHSGMRIQHQSEEILLVLHDSGNIHIPHFSINFLLRIFQENIYFGITSYSYYSLMKVHIELTLNLHHPSALWMIYSAGSHPILDKNIFFANELTPYLKALEGLRPQGHFLTSKFTSKNS